MSFLKKLAGQTAIYGLSSVVPRLLNYLLIILHSRVFLQPEQYGVITEIYAYLGFLLVFLTFGFETGYFRFASQEKNSSKTFSTAFLTLTLLNSLFFLAVFLFRNPIVSSIGYPCQPIYVVVPAAIIALDCIAAIPFARLRQLDKPLTFSTIKILGVVLNVFFNIFFLKICPNSPFLTRLFFKPELLIAYVFIANLIASAFTTSVVLIYSRKEKFNFSASYLKQLLIYSIPLLISGIGGTTNETFDRIFIKYLVPEAQNPLYQLGIYGSNAKLAVLMVLFIQMYRYAAEPFFFKAAADNTSRIIYRITTKYFFAFTLLVFLGVGLFTDIFQFIVGKSYRTGLSVVPILLLANVFYGLFFNLSVWYKLTNKTLYGILFTFVGAAVTVSVNLVLTAHIGFYGAAWARLACYIVMCFLCLLVGQRYFQIPYDYAGMGLTLTIAIALFLLGFYIPIANYFLSFLFRGALVLSFALLFYLYESRYGDKQFNFKKNEG